MQLSCINLLRMPLSENVALNVALFDKKNDYLPNSSIVINKFNDDSDLCRLEILKVYQAGVITGSCTSELEIFNHQQNLVVPIIFPPNTKPNKHPWGLLIAHQYKIERKWQFDEQEMLTELSVQLAIAIQQAELLVQTQTALAKERQLNTFKSQIVATISHEYRTPLTSILTAASTIKQHGTKLDPIRQQKFLEIIENKARHLS
ncbi:MAG: GAF domain-containing protein, partial [Calothrix sp. SM1_7_51]|nr:GAF domain-containing protein [Calothrix sp. SM1_7_51]